MHREHAHTRTQTFLMQLLHSLSSSWTWHDCRSLSRQIWEILSFPHKSLVPHCLQLFTVVCSGADLIFLLRSVPKVLGSAWFESQSFLFLCCLEPQCLWELHSACLYALEIEICPSASLPYFCNPNHVHMHILSLSLSCTHTPQALTLECVPGQI